MVAGGGGQGEAQVGPAGADAEVLLVDVGQDAVVDVGDRDVRLGVHELDGERGQVVVADAEQSGARQPEAGPEQQGPAQDRVGRGGDVVERVAGAWRAGDQLAQPFQHGLVVRHQVADRVLGRRRDGQQVLEGGPVRLGHAEAVAGALQVQDAEQRLDRPP